MAPQLKKRPKKPAFPKKVYRDGKLFGTIVDFGWVGSNSLGMKSGWFPIMKLNFNHPFIRKMIAGVRSQQQEIEDRKQPPSWEYLNRPMDI